MALVRFRSATWHKGWYFNATLSIQPLPLPVSLFAERDRWWHLARAPDSGRLSSTGALLQHGDAFFLDPTARRVMAQAGRKRARGHPQQQLGGLQQPHTLHGLIMGSGSGSWSDDGEEEEGQGPEVYVPARWGVGAEWPRLETTRPRHHPPLALPAAQPSSTAPVIDGNAYGAPACLPVDGARGPMASAVWPPAAAGAVLPPFSPQEQGQGSGGGGGGGGGGKQLCHQPGPTVPVKAQQGMDEEKEHAPDAARAAKRGGGVAVLAPVPVSQPQPPPGMAPGVRGRARQLQPATQPPAAQSSTVSMYYHYQQHQQQLYHQQRGVAAGAYGGGVEGGLVEDDGLLDLLCDSSLLFL